MSIRPFEAPFSIPRGGPPSAVRSPYTGEVLAEVELVTREGMAAVLDALGDLARDRSRTVPLHRRIEILEETARLMREERDDLALTIAREGGKPLADARVEVDRAIGGTKMFGAEMARLAGEEIPMGATAAASGRLAFTTREPVGVVAAISAFNHPLNLIVHQAGAAIAAGCPVIVKPAPETPLSAIAFGDLVRRAGLPAEWCIVSPSTTEVAAELAASDRIAYLSFIGSAAVGWSLRGKLAAGVRCSLEHGGAAPVIVDESADLDKAVPLLLKGGYYHAGQVCVSVQRIFVHARVKDVLVERLIAGVRALRTGDPTLVDTEVGPLIRAREVTRVHSWIEEARAGGGHVACGGQPLAHQCYEPTVVVDPPADSLLMTQEVFGPVVGVTSFERAEEAAARANALPWSFQSAIFTQDIDRAILLARALDASTVLVNDHTAFRADWMPFGGRRQSGLGLGGIRHGLEELTQSKMVVFKG